jgi:hypothetical protein
MRLVKTLVRHVQRDAQRVNVHDLESRGLERGSQSSCVPGELIAGVHIVFPEHRQAHGLRDREQRREHGLKEREEIRVVAEAALGHPAEHPRVVVEQCERNETASGQSAFVDAMTSSTVAPCVLPGRKFGCSPTSPIETASRVA